ncbi:hypothetical protein [Wolbachia endosymbiont of Chironomus riparius]|uniref:hypothetical protein n=1 Tax=Wolbachia endosymbiont of Chironomus riparius TaxID=2883238 RepID=UPI0020A228E0|nr:hypothetical protein [Wolbachia endosymbiont of Chironomus riparius]
MSEDFKDFLKASGLSTTIGGMIGLGLGLIPLSPFIIGIIVSSVLIATCIAYVIKIKNNDLYRKDIIQLTSTCVAGVVTGVGLSIAANVLFFGVMLNPLLVATSVGIAIGFSMSLTSLFTGEFIATQIDDYIHAKNSKSI